MSNCRKPDQLDGSVGVAFRLSQDELACIAPSVQMVTACYRAAQADGGVPDRVFLRVCTPKELDAASFDEPLMNMLVALADSIRLRLGQQYSNYRLRCHALELAAMSFSIRLMKRQYRHGHLHGAFRFPDQRLTAKLENLRRKALRRAKKESCDGIYSNLQFRWRRLERWIAFCLFHCDCHRASVYSGFRRRRRYVAIAANIASGAIRQQLNRSPSEAQLHRLVRRAFRYARLGRIGFSIRELVSDTAETRDEYVYLYRIWATQLFDLAKEDDDGHFSTTTIQHEQD